MPWDVSSLPTPTVEDFAILLGRALHYSQPQKTQIRLGLSNGTSPFIKKLPLDGQQRFQSMHDCVRSTRFNHTFLLRYLLDNLQTVRLQQGPEPQQQIILAGFCAKYLPATIDLFVNRTTLEIGQIVIPDTAPLPAYYYQYFDPPYYMICVLYHHPYFSKFLNSRKPISASRKRVIQVLVSRIIAVASECDSMMMEPEMPPPATPLLLGLTALRAILLLRIKAGHGLSRQTQAEFLASLHRWKFQHYHDTLGLVIDNIVSILTGTPFRGSYYGGPGFSDPHDVRAELLKERKICAWPSCDSSENLRTCARCQTVCYVSNLIL
ncbi:hypothetical protein BDN72DRAFT_297584 [Pluteus cervinus]|uniref:Uncharacterized protein n=1 Tax=Pluteus cervinus TaxID=181527 RepID=A0ACD3B528_9AGAR|nr:hypothetical protein BDN72DRAFT_297584 [Pluteus cervinus]